MDDCIESDIVFKWTNCCRLCLSTTADIDIFNSETILKDITEKFQLHLNFLIYRGDPMPRKLCQSCSDNVDMWHNFRLKCIETEENLKKRLSTFRMLDFVQNFFDKDADFHSPARLPEVKASTLPCSNAYLATGGTQESSASRGVADSTNTSFVGVPIKVEPVYDNCMNEDTTSDHNDDYHPANTPTFENILNEQGSGKSNSPAACEEGKSEERSLDKSKIDLELVPGPPNQEISHKDSSVANEDGIADEMEHIENASCSKEGFVPPPNNGLDILRQIADGLGNVEERSNTSIENQTKLVNKTTRVIKQEEDLVVGSKPPDQTEPVRVDNNCTEIQMGAQWTNEMNPGRITSVEGSALAHWHSQPNEECSSVKVEPLSPSEHHPENNEDPNNHEKAYYLRPRPGTTVNYGEMEEFESEEATRTQSFPVQLKLTPWKCEACKIYFGSSQAMKSHQDSFDCVGKNLESFRCQVCSKKFFSDVAFAEHNLLHLKVAYNVTVDELRKCSKCSLAFADAKRLQRHMKVHTVKKMPSPAMKFTCIDCGLVFIKKVSYDLHRISHSTPVVDDPPTGNENFNTSLPLPEPTVAANTTPKRDYACSLCISRFKSEDLLYDHRFATHGIPDERVACVTCSLKFRGPTELFEHIKTHETRSVARKSTRGAVVAPIKTSPALSPSNGTRCTRCGQVFSSQETLLQHIASEHKNAIPFSCRKCHRRFPSRSLLLIHSRTHARPTKPKVLSDASKEKSNILWADTTCQMCQVQFQLQSDYNIHMEKHPLADPMSIYNNRQISPAITHYHCPGCPELFPGINEFLRHVVVRHDGNDNWSPIKMIGLVKALKVTTTTTAIAQPSNTVECHICHLKLATQAAMNFHIKIKHKKKKNEQVPSLANNLEPKGTSKCPYCSQVFSASYIGRHIRQTHGKSQRYKCRVCRKSCVSLQNLKKHEKIHDNIPDWHCTCGKTLPARHKAKIAEHTKSCKRKSKISNVVTPPTPPQSTPSASSEFLHACPVCLNSYETQSLLELHVMTVHGMIAEPVRERDLWREECNKIVREVDGIIQCTVCRIPLSVETAAWHRKQHPRGNLYIVQIDENLYQCTVCDELLNGRENALQHASYHAAGDVKPAVEHLAPLPMLSCPFCSSQFKTKESIRNHIYYVHPDGANTV